MKTQKKLTEEDKKLLIDKMLSILPEHYDKSGNWILINKFIPIEYPILPLSIYFGKIHPRYNKAGYKLEHLGRSLKTLGDAEKIEWLCDIKTYYGQVTLRNHEFSILPIERLKIYVEEIKNNLYEFNTISSTLTKTLAEKIFSMQTRGISNVDSILMLLDSIKDGNIYFEPSKDFLYSIYDEEKINEIFYNRTNYQKMSVEEKPKIKFKRVVKKIRQATFTEENVKQIFKIL